MTEERRRIVRFIRRVVDANTVERLSHRQPQAQPEAIRVVVECVNQSLTTVADQIQRDDLTLESLGILDEGEVMYEEEKPKIDIPGAWVSIGIGSLISIAGMTLSIVHQHVMDQYGCGCLAGSGCFWVGQVLGKLLPELSRLRRIRRNNRVAPGIEQYIDKLERISNEIQDL